MVAEYVALFYDLQGKKAPCSFWSGSDGDAVDIVNAMKANSDAGLASLTKRTPIALSTFDATTNPTGQVNYDEAADPAANSSVQIKGKLFYIVQTPKRKVTLEIPAVKSSVVSPASQQSGTDPISGSGVLQDNEGDTTTAFQRVRYLFRPRKNRQ